jgi:hypothetical protein
LKTIFKYFQARYDYSAKKTDELTFVKGDVISNVHKQVVDWWRGDLGGKKQHWFPANFVEVRVHPL